MGRDLWGVALQAEGGLMSPTWAGWAMSSVCFLAPTLRPATAPLYLPTALLACTTLATKDGLGPSKSLRGYRGGALPR